MSFKNPRAEFEAKEFPAEFAKVDTNSETFSSVLESKYLKYPETNSSLLAPEGSELLYRDPKGNE